RAAPDSGRDSRVPAVFHDGWRTVQGNARHRLEHELRSEHGRRRESVAGRAAAAARRLPNLQSQRRDVLPVAPRVRRHQSEVVSELAAPARGRGERTVHPWRRRITINDGAERRTYLPSADTSCRLTKFWPCA